MAVSVTPIKPLTRLDRTNSSDLYRAMDNQGERPRYLNMAGTGLTYDLFWSWYGTKRQFKNLCDKYEWDGFTLVPADKLRF